MFVLSWSFYPHSPPCSKQQSKTDSHTNQRSNAECVVKGSQGCAQIMGAEFPTLARSPPDLGVETLGIPKWAMFKPRNTIPSYLLARNWIPSGWWSSPVPNYPNFYWILESKIPEKLPTNQDSQPLFKWSWVCHANAQLGHHRCTKRCDLDGRNQWGGYQGHFFGTPNWSIVAVNLNGHGSSKLIENSNSFLIS
jgi:hypothetical protein